MGRKPREKSLTGIYHVMLRGINKQDIFFERDDFVTMQRVINEARREMEGNRVIGYKACTFYAYCILHNHCHLLIREGSLDVSSAVKKIAERYANFYNRKYDRVGHLFQGRYASEPVSDINYFHTLLRYIHRNPVKAMEAKMPGDYEYSSWREYMPNVNVDIPICDVSAVLRSFDLEELTDFVCQDVDDECMDMDGIGVMNEEDAWHILAEISKAESPEEFRILSPEWQLSCVEQAIQRGISVRQASRFSSLTFYMIRKHLSLLSDEEKQECRNMSRESSLPNKEMCLPADEKLCKIVEYIEENQSCSTDMIANYTQQSVSSVKRCLYKLIAEGYVVCEGGNRNRTYRTCILLKRS